MASSVKLLIGESSDSVFFESSSLPPQHFPETFYFELKDCKSLKHNPLYLIKNNQYCGKAHHDGERLSAWIGSCAIPSGAVIKTWEHYPYPYAAWKAPKTGPEKKTCAAAAILQSSWFHCG